MVCNLSLSLLKKKGCIRRADANRAVGSMINYTHYPRSRICHNGGFELLTDQYKHVFQQAHNGVRLAGARGALQQTDLGHAWWLKDGRGYGANGSSLMIIVFLLTTENTHVRHGSTLFSTSLNTENAKNSIFIYNNYYNFHKNILA